MNSRKTALFIATVSSFLTPFTGSSVNIALPVIAKEFGMNAVTLSWVASAYLLSAAVLLIPFGKLADMYGRKKIFTIGITIFTLSSVMSALSFSGWWMIFSRIIQGIGSTMLFGTGIAIITSIFPPGERGKAIGINASAVYIGLALGPFLGGILTESIGWRSIFWINVPFGLLVFWLASAKLPGEWKSEKVGSFDFPGALLYGFSLIFLMLGFSELNSGIGVYLCLTGFVLLTVFIYWEKKKQDPLLDISLFFNNRPFAYSNLAALINYSSTFAIVFLLSLYLQYVKNIPVRNSGFILFAQPITMAIFAPVSGRLSDKIEPRILSSIGMGICMTGLLLLSFINHGSSIGFIMGTLILLGAGFALFSSPNTNAIMSSVSKHQLGIASAMVGTMRLTGQMFSMGFAMLLISIFIGKDAIQASNESAFLSAMRIAFLIFSSLSFVGIFFSCVRGNITTLKKQL